MLKIFRRIGVLFTGKSKEKLSRNSLFYKKEISVGFVNSIKESFSKLKEENKFRDENIEQIKRRVNYHSLCLKSQNKMIENLEKQLNYLSKSVGKALAMYPEPSPTVTTTSPTLKPASATLPKVEIEPKYADINSLTHLQQVTLFTIANIMMKENAKWISMKTLVNTVYPGKPYNTVRTTIFEYIKILEELGFVKREKHGNLTYISVTDKALKIINEKETNRKTKLIKLTKNISS